ncbi:MAG: acyltransferase family protein, partial [Akkermansiaceae bacterium]
ARAWELLIGALVALTPVTQKPRWLSELCGFLGIGFILTAMFTLDKASPFPGVAAILPCVGTALFIFAGQNQVGIAGKILSASPLVFCGKISYSLYLWHWPLLVYANHLAAREASVTVRIILVVASIILAIASWRWVETPFRTKSLFGERKKLFKFFYISTASLVLLAAAIYYSKGIPQRLNESQRIVNEAIEEDSPIKDTKGILKGEPLPSILPDAPPAATLVWGDSHTSVLVTPLRDLCKTYNTNMYCATRASHPPLLDVSLYPREKDVAGFNDKVMAFIDEKKIKHVILCARWSFYASGKFPGQEKSHMRDREHSDTPQAEVFEKHFALTISKLRERGIRVWVLQQIPFHYRSPPELIFHGMRFGRSLNELGSTISEHEERQKHPNSVFANTEGITVIDPLQVFATNTEHCRIESDGKSLYRDEDHLTMFGSRMLIPLLTPIFEEIAPRSAP